MADLPKPDPLLVHAREFTNIEVRGLTVWNALQDAGQPDLARNLLDAILQHEHYTSLLPNRVSERSADQLAQQAKLAELANALFDQANAALQTTVASVMRPQGDASNV